MTRFVTLTSTEAESTAEAIETLRPLPWARPMLERVPQGGGLITANMSALFETRFGRALHDCGIAPVYEHATGVGGSSVDFAFGNWNVELLSFDETDAATAPPGSMGHRSLQCVAADGLSYIAKMHVSSVSSARFAGNYATSVSAYRYASPGRTCRAACEFPALACGRPDRSRPHVPHRPERKTVSHLRRLDGDDVGYRRPYGAGACRCGARDTPA